MITTLVNPKTETYQHVKYGILSDTFPWYYQDNVVTNDLTIDEGHRNFSCFYNRLLSRAATTNERRQGIGHKYPTSTNFEHMELFEKMLDEIWDANGIDVNVIYRISVNLVYPQNGIQHAPKHTDHDYPHTNLLIYFTDSGGKTVYDKYEHDPQEDDIITFDGLGEHYYHLPKENRRVVLVATYA